MPLSFFLQSRWKLAALLAMFVAVAVAVPAARTIGEELQLTWPAPAIKPPADMPRDPAEEPDERLASRQKVSLARAGRIFGVELSRSIREPAATSEAVAVTEPMNSRQTEEPRELVPTERLPQPLPEESDDLLTEPETESPAEPAPAPAEPSPRRLPPPEEETPLPSPEVKSIVPQAEEIPAPRQPFVGELPQMDASAQIAPYSPLDFGPDPLSYSPGDEENSADATYRAKTPVPVQRPWVEWGRGFYLPGQYPAGGTMFGPTNLTLPHFLVYGDLRTVLASNQSNDIDTNVWATKLQLESDFKITATERIHALFTPLNRLNDVTRLEHQTGQGTNFFDVFNANPTTAFFEGDAGAILGGMRGIDSPFDLPFTVGLIPLFFQNGVWMNDAILGAAVNIPARHSRLLDWPNYETTFFCGFDQVTSDAFRGDNQAADVFGTATFIEAYGGYIETGYAFLSDDTAANHSYHNLTAAFTRRYFDRVSNSVRGIVNLGQSSSVSPQSADGLLLLMENSLITRDEQHLVPYCNLFAGFGSPQSVARGAAAGGVLSNTGISFEIDNITNYPTLDATGHNACGGALGIELLGPEFYYQFIVETAYVHVYGNPASRLAVGDQASISGRFQVALSKSILLRTDLIYGALEDAPDILGGRLELRHKF